MSEKTSDLLKTIFINYFFRPFLIKKRGGVYKKPPPFKKGQRKKLTKINFFF